jgi:hypothetical protein
MARYPKALFLLTFAGYDDDPRELHELPEVCAYARTWAELAGMDNEAAAESGLEPARAASSLRWKASS